MVTTRHVTVEEFATMPRDGLWELIDGEPIEVTPAAGRSSRIGGRLYARLVDHVEPSGFGWAYPADAGFVLFGDRAVIRSPDAAFVRRDRLPEEPEGFVPLAPDFAAEVLSPTDRRSDALAKVAMYLQAGVRLVWLIDPDRRLVEVFQPDEPVATFAEEDMLDGGDVIPGFRLRLADILTK